MEAQLVAEAEANAVAKAEAVTAKEDVARLTMEAASVGATGHAFGVCCHAVGLC